MEKAREFEVSFGVDTGELNKIDTFQMTGEGDAKNILETVAKIINDFYYQYEEDIDKIIIDGTNEKRRRVYKLDRKSTRLNSSHMSESRMPSSA